MPSRLIHVPKAPDPTFFFSGRNVKWSQITFSQIPKKDLMVAVFVTFAVPFRTLETSLPTRLFAFLSPLFQGHHRLMPWAGS